MKEGASVSSSHLFSLLHLSSLAVFHDAKPEWEWTNLLRPERTEWAAAHQRWRQGWSYLEKGRRLDGLRWRWRGIKQQHYQAKKETVEEETEREVVEKGFIK